MRLKKRPPFAKQFKPAAYGEARIIVGWPGGELAPFYLVLPADEDPEAFDWRAIEDCHVFVQPVPGETVADDILHRLGVELIAAGAASIFLWNGEHIAGSWWRNQLDDPGFYDGFDDGDGQ